MGGVLAGYSFAHVQENVPQLIYGERVMPAREI
jgi:hypothetical protein